MKWLLLAVLLSSLPGCRYLTTKTKVRVRIGGPHVKRVAVLPISEHSEEEILEGLSKVSEPVRFVDHKVVSEALRATDAAGQPLVEQACRLGLQLKRMGEPVDRILVARFSEGGGEENECVKRGMVSVGEFPRTSRVEACLKKEYRGQQWTVGLNITVVDAQTCTVRQTREVSATGRDHDEDRVLAKRRALERAYRAVPLRLASIFRNYQDLKISHAEDQTVRLTGNTQGLRMGELLIHKRSASIEERAVTIGRARVVQASPHEVEIESEETGTFVREDDLLASIVGVHQWSLYPTLLATHQSAEDRTEAGASVVGTWSRLGSLWFVGAELGGSGYLKGRIGHDWLSVGTGLRASLGRFQIGGSVELIPIAIFKVQPDATEWRAFAPGLGGRLSLSGSHGSFFWVVDLNLRRHWLRGDWRNDESAPTFTQPEWSETRVTNLLFGAGWRIDRFLVGFR